jgi:septal ring factor EnvC (AmiA/AmiB activator)
MQDFLQQKIQTMNVPSELPEGHYNRFESKLQKQLDNENMVRWPIYSIAIAASIVLLICLSIVKFSTKESKPELILAKENSEVVETEQYFQAEISQRITLIKSLEAKSNKRKKFESDIKELDESLNSLRNDLQEAPGDQRVVDAILNTYILKIETLDNIVSILQKYS